jgi:hypothetical protein
VEVDRLIEVAEGAAVPVAAESQLQYQRQVLVWRKDSHRRVNGGKALLCSSNERY